MVIFKNKCTLITLLLLAISMYVCFFNLDGSYLWKDEAHTAFIAKNILKYGLPKVWDGQNLLTGTEGNDFNEQFVLISKGWMQFYITAVSFYFLGTSTFAARLPFAMLGFLTIIINYLLAKKIFKKESLATLTLFFNVVCVQYILYIRTCRDYAITMFFISLTTYLMLIIFENRRQLGYMRKIDTIMIIGSSISLALLLYSNHLFGGVYCISLIGYTILFEHFSIKRSIVIVSIGILVWIPWYIYVLQSGVPSGYQISSNIVDRFLIGAWKIQTYFFPFITIIVLMLILGLISKKSRHCSNVPRALWFFTILVSANVIIVSFVEFFIVNHYYLTAAVTVPFFMTFSTMMIIENSKILAVPFVISISFTNVLNIQPYYWIKEQNIINADGYSYGSEESEVTCAGIVASPFTEGDGSIRSLKRYISDIEINCNFANMLYEIQYGYDGINKEISELLNKLGNDNDVVLYAGAEPEPFAFYTNMKLIRTLSKDVTVFENYFDSYPNQKYEYLVDDSDEDIDWIIISSLGRILLFHDEDFLKKNYDKFEVYETNVTDTFLSNSPDLDYHMFKPKVEGKKVTILHKKKGW